MDVRDREKFESGHVAGARHLPVHELATRRRELPVVRAKRIVIVGDAPKRMEAAANFLSLVGYADIGVLEGGFAAWTGPIETGPPAAPTKGPDLRVV